MSGWIIKSFVSIDRHGNVTEFSLDYIPPIPNFHRMSRRETEYALGIMPPPFDPPYVERQGGYLVPLEFEPYVRGL